MGISMHVVAAPDEELLRLRSCPEQLDHPFKEARPNGSRPGCLLFSYWRGLHALLTETQRYARLPACALDKGDFSYRGAEDPTHALLASTTSAFAALLGGLTKEHVREYFERRRVEAAARGPNAAPAVVWAATPSAVTQQTDELWSYLRSLQAVAAEAAALGHGLLLCRYEDW